MWTWQSRAIGRVCGGGEKMRKKEEEGGGGDGEGSPRGKRGLLGISHGSRRQDLVGLLFLYFFFFRQTHQVFSFLGFLLLQEQSPLSSFIPPLTVGLQCPLWCFNPFNSSIPLHLPLFFASFLFVPKLHMKIYDAFTVCEIEMWN